MATAAEVSARIRLLLENADAMLEDLRLPWGREPEAAQAAFSHDWDQFVSTDLPELRGYYERGEMTEPQATQYRDLLRRVREAGTTAQQLRLWWPPPVSIEP